jgi:transcription-repair coupling factor (superfamily II helicase)
VPGEEIKSEIHLNIPAFIPEDYMTDVNRRLVTYKRISMAATDEALKGITEELMDCYGFIPHEVKNLLEVIGIRNLLKVVKGTKMGYDGKHMFIFFHPACTVDPAKIVRLSRKELKGSRLTPDFKFYVPMPGLREEEIIKSAKDMLRMLID